MIMQTITHNKPKGLLIYNHNNALQHNIKIKCEYQHDIMFTICSMAIELNTILRVNYTSRANASNFLKP